VHGAFVDASSWNALIQRLQAHGVNVTAPANPLGRCPRPSCTRACHPPAGPAVALAEDLPNVTLLTYLPRGAGWLSLDGVNCGSSLTSWFVPELIETE
jgi:hypothetical protein